MSPTLATGNHPFALRKKCNVAANVTAKVREWGILGPFDALPFTPWCHINVLLTWPKKDNQLMDISWLYSPAVSVNGYTPKYTYLVVLTKMHLLSVRELVQLIQEAGKSCFLYCRDVF